MAQELDREELMKGVLGFSVFVGAIACAPVAGYWLYRWKSSVRPKFTKNEIIVCIAALLFLFLFWILFLDPTPFFKPDALYPHLLKHQKNIPLVSTKIIWLWCAGLSVSHLIAPVVLRLKKEEKGVRTQYFIRSFLSKKTNWKLMRIAFQISNEFPIGIDVKTLELISVSDKTRTHHMLVIGAPGSGKTTLMANAILYAVKHNQPCVVIDPKGDDSTLGEIINYGRMLTPDFDERFQLFTISKPGKSFKYNPLKHGSASELKDRIMEALTWSEQYYQNIAGDFLTQFTAATEYLGQTLTLDRISKVLSFKEDQASILNELKNRFQSGSGNERALKLMDALSQFFSKNYEGALSGLSAQISILNNPTFGSLLSFDTTKNEIDFRESRKKGKIVYFQLNTLGNGDSARRLGRMVIEDLKALSGEVYSTEPIESLRPFFPIFIDEFGSFATREFIEFLKQSRGANFGVHLFCQGLEDLDVVSPEFRRQVITCTKTKIGMRMDDHETVNEICATAGTFDAIEQSYQVEGDLMVKKTGMGNMRLTKQMQIEHDVFKQLRTGEAVVIQKSPIQVNGILICQASELV